MDRNCSVQVKTYKIKHSFDHPLEKFSNRFVTIAGTVVTSEDEHFSAGERVIGITPSSSQTTESGNVMEISSYYLCKIPSELNPADCVSVLEPSLEMYTALYYMCQPKPGDSVLIVSPFDTSLALVALQICGQAKLKTFTVCFDDPNRATLEKYADSVIRLDSYNTGYLTELTKRETRGRNFDIIFHFTHSREKDEKNCIPFSELVSCLGVMGRIVSTDHSLSLSTRETASLHLKSASLHFLFSHSWLLSPLKLGCYQHILKDILNKLLNKELSAPSYRTVPVSKFSRDIAGSQDEAVGSTVFQIC